MQLRPSFPWQLLVAVGISAGCATSSSSSDSTPTAAGEPAPTALVTSALERDRSPTVSAEDRAIFAADRADFAFDLLREVAAEHAGTNVVLSPYGASIALAMTYAGSGNDTKTALAKGLRFTLPEATTHAAFDAIDLALATRTHPFGSKGLGAVELTFANALWAPAQRAWDPAFLDVLKRSYGAGVNTADFEKPSAVASTINAWVAKLTHDRIPSLVQASDVAASSWLLTNAIYFKADWAEPFVKSATTDVPFHAPARDVVVPTMFANQILRAVHREEYDAVELPYDGKELAMVIVVPARGRFDATVAGLAGHDVLALPLADATVSLHLPRFETRTGGGLSRALGALGGPLQGDFPGHAGQIQVVQEAWIAVDEEGTEAAAATGVYDASAATEPPPPLVIDVDRPFVYAVVDRETRAILFLGETLDPSTK